MRGLVVSVTIGVVCFLVACGPAPRRSGGDDGTGGPDAPIGTTGPEVCTDAYDNDGDGRADCGDTDCSGRDGCPVCGAVENPQATPLALPDGVSSGAMCTTDAQCGGTSPNCVAGECHGSYTSTLNFVGFAPNATLTDPTKLLNVCVVIEHSYLRDLQIELITPPDSSGMKRVFILDKWYDRTTAEEIFLGGANDNDTAASPVAGTGEVYCWTPTAMTEMINHMTGVAGPTTQIPGGLFGPIKKLTPGDFKASSVWSALGGVTLNGEWTMRVTDLWVDDNGFMFKWSIKFDPSLVSDCSGPIIL